MNMISNQRVITCINDVRQFCEQNTGGSQFINFLDKLEKYVTRVQFSAANAGVQKDIASYLKKVNSFPKLYSYVLTCMMRYALYFICSVIREK